jgi:outer membrane protein assembly factor BamB
MNDPSLRRDPFRARLLSLTLTAFLLTFSAVTAGNWPAWRGPNGSGFSDEKDLPLTWGGKEKTNVLWKVTLPGRGSSSPIVWGERVFITSAAKQSDQDVKNKVVPEHHVSCYQAATGKELWKTTVPHGPFADGYYSIPTPVTDGKRIYTWFGSGVAAALDFDGRIVWRKERPGPYKVYPGVSSSPILFGTTVLILADQGRESFLLALDRDTGEVKWERKRPEMLGSTNSTPILVEVKGRPQLVVAAARLLQGLDPTDGKVVWWCGKDGGYWTSLTAGSGLVYVDSGGGRGVAVDPTGSGDVSKTHVKWQHDKVPEGLGCPIIVGEYLYRVSKPGILQCWKLATGEEVFKERLNGISFLASPFATPDGRIYFASTRGSFVIRGGVARLEVLANNALEGGGDDGPSPAAAGGRLFLKTTTQMWCIGRMLGWPAPG